MPRRLAGSTVVCLGTGPSLTREDVDACGGLPIIAVNDAIALAPMAAVLYACDRKWWRAHPETMAFPGLKFGLEPMPDRPDVAILEHTGDQGLELRSDAVRTGKNSGYQAINVAVHLGATRIILLGYDMQAQKGRLHFFDARARDLDKGPNFDYFRQCFASLVKPLRDAGVTVINCSRTSALQCFPRQSLDVVLSQVAA